LLAYRWDKDLSDWLLVADATTGLFSTSKMLIADTITIAPVPLQNKTYAFVGHDAGFATFDVTSLTHASPSMQFVQHVCSFPGCQVDSGVLGLARAGDRLLLWIDEPGIVPGRIRIMEWNEGTGLAGNYKDFGPGSLAFPPLGEPWPSAFRARFRETSGAPNPAGDYFVCSSPYLLQYRWGKGATLAEDTLVFKGLWQSAYREEVQDCHLFAFPTFGLEPKLLVAKNSEAFAIVEPLQ
jgi:hypothetical protein